MAALNHKHTSELEYVVDDAAGLGEFNSEGGAVLSLSRSPRGPAVLQEVGTLTVIEQYEPVDLVDWAVTSSVAPWWAAMKTATAAVLVIVTTGAPLGTELPDPGTPVRVVETVQPPAPTVPLTAVPAEPQRHRESGQRPPTIPAVAPSEAPSGPPSELELASLRKAFDSLNGPFMTFEHCEVRLASADRALARCQGTRSEAESGGESPPQRRVEWTLDFDRAGERWLIVDAAAR